MSWREDLLDAYAGEPKTTAQAVAFIVTRSGKQRHFSAWPYVVTKDLINEGLVQRVSQTDDVPPRWRYQLVMGRHCHVGNLSGGAGLSSIEEKL